ncbi:ABC transporter substrate binding protein [Desulfobacterales bacterium HSG17]|nr:ABC transporter substrate binding protein [Desulfobacterales bacterium HSG17]
MKQVFIQAFILSLLVSFTFNAFGEEKKWKFKVNPVTNNGKKWKIGYYEGGPYIAYQKHLKNILNNLIQLGWMDKIELPNPEDKSDTTALWTFLSQNVRSEYIEFVSDAYWTSGWDSNKRMLSKKEALKRLKANEIELMLAMGTWAGQDLINDLHSVSTMGISISNPIDAKIITSPDDSGFDHAHIRCDPDRDLRMIRLFYNIFQFKKLGVVYEDSLEGRSYAAIDALEKVAHERNFELISTKVLAHDVDENTGLQLIIEAHKKLAPQIDAFLITTHRSVIPKNMSKLMAPFLKYKIPTFAQYGTVLVKYGALISINQTSAFDAVGRYNAKVIASIFNGAKPREIDQIFASPKKLAVNMEVARIIGFDIPPGLKSIVDEKHTEIKVIQ